VPAGNSRSASRHHHFRPGIQAVTRVMVYVANAVSMQLRGLVVVRSSLINVILTQGKPWYRYNQQSLPSPHPWGTSWYLQGVTNGNTYSETDQLIMSRLLMLIINHTWDHTFVTSLVHSCQSLHVRSRFMHTRTRSLALHLLINGWFGKFPAPGTTPEIMVRNRKMHYRSILSLCIGASRGNFTHPIPLKLNDRGGRQNKE
jgi:hypothetical protein